MIERRITEELTYSDEQFGFMPKRSTTDAVFTLHQLIEKYREEQKIYNACQSTWKRHTIEYQDKKYGTANEKKKCRKNMWV